MEAFRALPVFVAVTLAMPLLVSAAERDQDSETATRPEYGLKLNAARRLDENAPSEEGDAPTYLTAFKMIGTPNEKIELIDALKFGAADPSFAATPSPIRSPTTRFIPTETP